MLGKEMQTKQKPSFVGTTTCPHCKRSDIEVLKNGALPDNNELNYLKSHATSRFATEKNFQPCIGSEVKVSELQK